MRRVLIVLILAAVGFVVWTNFVSPRTASAADSQLADLENRLEAAKARVTRSGRAAGISGVDTTADAGAVPAEVDRIERSLRDLAKSLDSEAARQRSDRLQKKIDEFRRQFGN